METTPDRHRNARSRVRRHGRVTLARVLVLDAISSAKCAVSPSRVLDHLSQQVTRPSVYRAIEWLTNKGLVLRVHPRCGDGGYVAPREDSRVVVLAECRACGVVWQLASPGSTLRLPGPDGSDTRSAQLRVEVDCIERDGPGCKAGTLAEPWRSEPE